MPRARTPKPAPAEENTAPSSTAAPGPSIDASFLHTLVGYNARRAS
ncbi:MAG: MarR family transcriptional regulator, partial [Delftia sp.]|nr:MarR family transcriptional regulator [Delftia sp.]